MLLPVPSHTVSPSSSPRRAGGLMAVTYRASRGHCHGHSLAWCERSHRPAWRGLCAWALPCGWPALGGVLMVDISIDTPSDASPWGWPWVWCYRGGHRKFRSWEDGPSGAAWEDVPLPRLLQDFSHVAGVLMSAFSLSHSVRVQGAWVSLLGHREGNGPHPHVTGCSLSSLPPHPQGFCAHVWPECRGLGGWWWKILKASTGQESQKWRVMTTCSHLLAMGSPY